MESIFLRISLHKNATYINVYALYILVYIYTYIYIHVCIFLHISDTTYAAYHMLTYHMTHINVASSIGIKRNETAPENVVFVATSKYDD